MQNMQRSAYLSKRRGIRASRFRAAVPSRIKVGVGMPEHPDHEMIDWVIGKPTGQEAKTLREALDRAAKAALYLVDNGVEKAMNRYN